MQSYYTEACAGKLKFLVFSSPDVDSFVAAMKLLLSSLKSSLLKIVAKHSRLALPKTDFF